MLCKNDFAKSKVLQFNAVIGIFHLKQQHKSTSSSGFPFANFFLKFYTG